MSDYIVCHRKRNSPRLSVRICEERCEYKNQCKEYLDYINSPINQKPLPFSPEKAPIALSIPS